MSREGTDWASRQRPAKSSDKMILWALGDHAAKGGNRAFPSVAALCDFTLLKRQTVMECLARLEATGLIRDTGERVGRTKQIKVWELPLQRVRKIDL